MRDEVRACIGRYSLLDRGDRVIVALSGGADSVSLLHVLCSLREEYELQISAAHFNHMIRGAEADRDEAFCRELCESMGVALYTAREDVPAAAEITGESLELCGRRLRYAYLTQLGERLGAVIATAHTMSDNTETVLLNLTRGSGLAGMAGIPPVRGSVIRPLLGCTRAQVEDYCRVNGLDYVTDSTNLDDVYTRNKLRLRVLPNLRSINPSLDETVERMSAVMRDADGYFNNISVKELNNCKTEYGYSCRKLLELDGIVLSYALRRLASLSGAPMDYARLELVIDAMRSGGAVELGSGYTAVCAQGILRITRGEGETPDELCVPLSAYARRISPSDSGEKINKKFLQYCIPCDIITDDTVVRRRRPGDTFACPRRGVTKSLRKLLNELKIPRERRDSLLLVARGSEVLWIEGVGASAQAQIPEGYVGELYLMGNSEQ